MVAKLVEDLFHFECCEDRFDQHRGTDRAPRYFQIVLREIENVIPQPCFDMAFELGQVEVRPAPLSQKSLGVMEEIKPKVKETARHRLAVDLDMTLVQVPATRPDKQRCDLLVQAVLLSFRAREI